MSFEVSYNLDPEIVKHAMCCRCEEPCENAPVGTGRVPLGPNGTLENIRNIVLCLMCVELMNEEPKKFWYEGWPHQRRKKKK